MNLYELSAQYRQLTDQLLAGDGEIPADVEAALNALDDSIAIKARNIVAIRRELGAEVEVMKAESNRLRTLATTREKADERLGRYLIDCLTAAGLDSVKTDIGRVTVAFASRPSIRWEGTGDMPLEYCKTKTVVSLDSDKALKDYKQHGELPEGFVVERSRYIRVS